MEPETMMSYNQPSGSKRMLAAGGPVLWIAISYIDPGKWATTLEGGARLGFDIALLMLALNCSAIFCQYLSARIAIATGKDLAQICREEYDGRTYLILGTQAETSMVVLDLTTVLGTACGLNAVFGIGAYSSVFLTGIDAFLFPFHATLFETQRAKLSSICLIIFILLSYVCGLLTSQPETSLLMGGMFNKLTGDNAYILMGLLGANIMPHNFYIHSSIVQRTLGQTSISKGALFHDHFFAILCVFGAIFLGNWALMNWAAHTFHGTGLVSLILPDALSLLDQVSRSSITSVSLVLIMFFSNQLISLPWSLGSRLISEDFFQSDIPCWFHRAAIRLVAIIIALYCVWSSGVDSIFQLVIFMQVLVAVLLPSSVIPLFKVASSLQIMGAYEISLSMKLLALASFVAMLGLNVFFLMELMLGSSDWVITLSWNIGNNLPILYSVLLIMSFASLGLMLWLAITPLKSATSRVVDQASQSDENAGIESFMDRNQIEISELQYQQEKGIKMEEPELSLDESLTSTLNLPETFLDSEGSLSSTTIQENKPAILYSNPSLRVPEASPIISLPGEVTKSESLGDISMLSPVSKLMVDNTVKPEGDLHDEKDDGGDNWETEASRKYVTESNQNLTNEGSGSFRSLTGKLDNVGSGTGSLSRLAGLGRAARRQLTSTLDEFWGQLFDFHGHVTQDAKAKNLDDLLGIDSKINPKSSPASVIVESLSKEAAPYFCTTGAMGTDSFKASSLYNSSMQQIGQSSVGSPFGVHHVLPMWSNYAQNANQSALDASERRYNSVHIPSSNAAYDQQPATFHGYDLASLIRTANEIGPDTLKGQVESLTRMPPSSKSNATDPYSRSLSLKSQNGSRMMRPPGFHNVPVSRNLSLKSERPCLDVSALNAVDYVNNPTNAKKYYSLPDISNLYVPNRESSLSGNKSQMDYSVGYGQSISRSFCDPTISSVSSWGEIGLGINELLPSKVYRDTSSLQFGSRSGTSSLWSKQPYERFGVADKSPPDFKVTETTADVEAKILQSFRSCINKLLKLEGSDWLFRQNDGADEDLIDRVAAREKFLYEVETRTNALKPEDSDQSKIMWVPNCGETCVWKVDLVISFGVWCIHRILELSLMESRPELWGKYTYVLNRLQGIIDPAFSKPRSSKVPCFCLQLPAAYQRKLTSPMSHNGLPPPSKLGRGKFTTAPMLLDMIKDVELAISCRKGRTGTAAGDVAFPKGKENLASVMKRYKRRLSSNPVGFGETGPRSPKITSSPLQGL